MISLEIPQIPTPWSAARVSRRGTYDPKATEKKYARWHIQQQYTGELIHSYVGIFFQFVFPVPKSASKKKQEKMLALEDFPTRCDTTNCQKFYEDCLKGIVLYDDRTVVITCAEKIYGTEGLVKIKINPISKLEAANFPC